MRIIKCSLHLNIYFTFGFHIVVSYFPFANLFWISNFKLRTWKIFSICFDKYFGIWLLNIKHLLKYNGSKLKYICFIIIDLAMYEMQITSYDANLSFFYGWIYNLCDYLIYKAIINMFFALNMKICRILRFMIRSYDLRSHLPSTILRKIPIWTTLVICMYFLCVSMYVL